MEKLGLNSNLLAFQILNFTIVLGFLNFLVLKPLSELMKRRQQQIAAGLAKEGEVDQKLAQIQADRQQQLSQVQSEIDQMMSDAARQATAIKEDILRSAKKDADALLARSRERIALEKAEMLANSREEIIDLAAKMVEKIIQDSPSANTIKKQINKHLIDQLWQSQSKKPKK